MKFSKIDEKYEIENINKIFNKIRDFIGDKRIHINESMKNHTSFKIGGLVSILIEISSIEELKKLIFLLKSEKIKYFIMGNGTNLLVSDDGYKGVIIKIADNFNEIIIEDNKVIAQAGVLLSTLSKAIAKKSLKGFEFASGIPGTVGGAVSMNAGAYDGEMKDYIEHVKVLTNKGEILNLSNEMMNFGYRTSDAIKKDYIVLETSFKFEIGSSLEVFEKIIDFTDRRNEKQPLSLPSAGSTFKRPVGYYAGKLIDDSGLRGVRLGDAQISEKHCGFVVNRGNATCKQVLDLIKMIQKVVKDNYNVNLETEVRYLGD